MAAPGSRPEEGAGLPGMGQFRLDIGVGIDGDADPDDDYRPSPDASSRRAPTQGQHGAAAGGQFGILAPPTMLSGAMEGHSDGARHVSFAADSHETQRKRPGKIVVDPPDLRAWREKLFNVDAMIVLTDEQYVLRPPLPACLFISPSAVVVFLKKCYSSCLFSKRAMLLRRRLTDTLPPDSRRTSPTWTTSTRTAQRSATSASRLSRTTGTAG